MLLQPSSTLFPLHDALPIYRDGAYACLMNDQDKEMFKWVRAFNPYDLYTKSHERPNLDRKSTRLNSSHRCISYAVFCLKKKNIKEITQKLHSTHKSMNRIDK